MEIFIVFVLFIIGLVIIIKGGDLFVNASVWFATVSGIPTIIIGATIVSLATTLPELFVSVFASLQGSPDMAIGNAVGSTICNIGLILSIAIIFMPGDINKRLFAQKGVLMIITTIVLLFFSIDTILSKREGYILLVFLGVFIVLNISQFKGKNRISRPKNNYKKITSKEIIINCIKFLLGTIFIIIGARLLVDNGQKIAYFFNVPEQIVSLTLIALGTSLPELTTALTAIIKGYEGISVGNIIGANILNNTMILGFSSIASDTGLVISHRNIALFDKVYNNVPQTLYIDLPVALVLMIILVVSGIVQGRLNKNNGLLLLLVYGIYLTFLAYSIFSI